MPAFSVARRQASVSVLVTSSESKGLGATEAGKSTPQSTPASTSDLNPQAHLAVQRRNPLQWAKPGIISQRSIVSPCPPRSSVSPYSTISPQPQVWLTWILSSTVVSLCGVEFTKRGLPLAPSAAQVLLPQGIAAGRHIPQVGISKAGQVQRVPLFPLAPEPRPSDLRWRLRRR